MGILLAFAQYPNRKYVSIAILKMYSVYIPSKKMNETDATYPPFFPQK